MSKSTPPDTSLFTDAYHHLNDQQKQAVDTTEGPVMVIAGPGTGKTQILALRIANILITTDAKAGDILALTFTDAGAKAMRERLRRYIGAHAYQVNIHTFHSFAGMLIKDYPEAFPSIIGGQPASDLERIRFIEDALNDSSISKLRPVGNPAYYVKPLLGEIDTLKQENISPQGLTDIINQQENTLGEIEQFHTKGAHKGKERGEYTNLKKEIDKNRELQHVYRLYDATMSEHNRFDYNDMIIQTVRALSDNESLLRDLQERFLYVLADEHQDVNGAQNQILEQLVSYHDSPNVFVVGDEKQAIYRFQGASLENFLYFQERFKNTTIISLTENYRSHQLILDAAHDIIHVEDGPLADLRVPLTGTRTGEASIHRRFAHEGMEEHWLAADIKEKLEAGTDPAEIAIIVRTNREVEHLTTYLRKQGIAVEASADSDILRHPITRTVQDIITAIVEPHNEAVLGRLVIGPCVNADPTSLATLFSQRERSTPLQQLLGSETALQEAGITDPTPYLALAHTLQEARQRLRTELPHDTIAYALRTIGLLSYLEANDTIEGVRVVRRLYDEIEVLVNSGEVTTMESLLQALQLREAYNVPLNAPYLGATTDAVQVMTAHKSKGLEFSVVYLPHATDNVWGSGRRREHFKLPLTKLVDQNAIDPLDDEKRLFYVAMTRAKDELIFLSSEQNSGGKELVPTRFLTDIDSAHLTDEQHLTDTAFDPLDRVAPAPQQAIDHALVRELFTKRGFSATSINNYLENPWHYFVRNLLRLPEFQGLPLRYGTAIHNVLEWITKERTRGGWPSESACFTRLELELQKHPLTTKEYTSLHEKGVLAITSYLPHLKDTIGASTKEELSITVDFATNVPELPTIPLSGKLDRLDIDQNGTVLRVVDYKTGKPRSRNQIEGKTKAGDRGYKRQLEFYALLLHLYDDERYRTTTFTLSFVEPTNTGAIKEESFVITEADLVELTAEINQAVQDIATGAFLTDTTLAEESEYPDIAKRFLGA